MQPGSGKAWHHFLKKTYKGCLRSRLSLVGWRACFSWVKLMRLRRAWREVPVRGWSRCTPRRLVLEFDVFSATQGQHIVKGHGYMFVLCLFYTTARWKPVLAIRVQCSGHVATDICKKSLRRSSSFHSTRPPSFCTSLSLKGFTFFHFIDTFIYIAMPSINKCFILFSLALSASALTTPHAIRHVNHHRAVAAALVATVPSPIVVPQGTRAVKAVRRRSNGGRCKATSSSATTAAPTPAANVEGAPPSRTGSSSSPDSTPKATPTSSSDQSSPSQKPASKQPASKQPATSSGGSGGNLPSYMEGTQTGQGKLFTFP